MARREDHLDVQARQAQMLAARRRCGRPRSSRRARSPGGTQLMTSASTRPLDLRAVDGRAGRAGDRRDRADVVEVAVGDQDRLDLDAERLDRVEQPLGLIARVDDHRARRRRRVGAHDVASSPGPARP